MLFQEGSFSEDLEDEFGSTTESKSTQKKRNKRSEDPVVQAMRLFDCSKKQIGVFKKKEDPLNAVNSIGGCISRKDGAMGGSLYITHVNEKRLNEPKLIFGTPKLEYPYKDFDDYEYKDFTGLKSANFLIANKWNGINVLFFKYYDADGNGPFISAKSKGSQFLHNSPFGQFLTLTRKVIGLEQPEDTIQFDRLPPLLAELKRDDVQSKTFELCGSGEPHLVRYDFELVLKPLFITYNDGSISPCSNPEDIGPLPFDNKTLVSMCTKLQEQDFQTNENYRKEQGLPLRYEYNHFIVEGRVLYLLNEQGNVIDRTMYKIKPKDIEEVHWSNFDSTIQGRVREAVEKIILRGKSINETALQEEMDMGPKEWSRFGEDVMKYVNQLTTGQIPSKLTDTRHLLVVAGFPGTQRSTFVRKLKEKGWIVVSGSSEEVRNILREKLKNNVNVVIEKWNVTLKQRKTWMEEAMKMGVLRTDCVFFDVSKEEAQEMLEKQRKSGMASSYIKSEEDDSFNANLIKPQAREGFTSIFIIKENHDIEKTIATLNSHSVN